MSPSQLSAISRSRNPTVSTSGSLLIAGSRSFDPVFMMTSESMTALYTMQVLLIDHLVSTFDLLNPRLSVTTAISGHAAGIDRAGERWAKLYQLRPSIMRPHWFDSNGVYNPRAGFERNGRMVSACTCALIIWDGESRGSLDTIDQLSKNNKQHEVVICSPPPADREALDDLLIAASLSDNIEEQLNVVFGLDI